MPATSLTRIYDTLLTLTLDAYKEQLADNIHSGIPLLWWLENRGRGTGIRFENGGAKIRIPVIWAKNTNAKSYSKYDRIDLTPTEEITAAFDDWKEAATSIALSRREIRQNSGRRQILNLIREKVNIAEMSFREEIERQIVQGTVSSTTGLFAAGNAGKDLNPLGLLVSKAEGSSLNDTVHSISTSTDSWWMNRGTAAAGTAEPSTATTRETHHQEMIRLYNHCSRGSTNDFPDLILSDQNYFQGYELSLLAQQRYGNYADEGAASVGFESLKFKGAVMLWSEMVPNFGTTPTDAVSLTQNSGRQVAWFLNSRWLELVIDEATHFINTPFEEPVDQTAIYSKILFMGQFTVTQRRKQGLHFDVADSWTT